MSLNSGKLWIVATPLGNPGDLSPRAREVLSRVGLVLAEDTRRAGLLLTACGVHPERYMSFHDHNEAERLCGVLELLRRGDELALVSDAGTPLLSDPGYRLVRACREEGIAVSPVPGPSAPTAALCASGLPPQPYAFLGFAPRKSGDQAAFFAPYASLPATLIFFERKDRLARTLKKAYVVLGEREACIARELTKTYEEFIRFALRDHASLPEELLGEFTVLIGPPGAEDRTPSEEVLVCLEEERRAGGRPREVAARVKARVSGWSVKEVYAMMPDQTERGS